MYLIIGLGNPGKKYERTRHNVGFITVDQLSLKMGIKVEKIKFKALIGEGIYKGEKVILVKPQTYMNLSGESVKDIISYYKPDFNNVFVIYDDIDLECGKLRIRKKGSAGTHNGMRNIIYMLGKDQFPRFRLGISKPPKGQDLASFVTNNFKDDEIKSVGEAIDNCVEAILYSIEYNIEKSMNKYNI
ncbi:MAG: aminoacyl-tRNA hydrolase [Filifactoraceae bacterium]